MNCRFGQFNNALYHVCVYGVVAQGDESQPTGSRLGQRTAKPDGDPTVGELGGLAAHRAE
jgi:hypothetical protein